MKPGIMAQHGHCFASTTATTNDKSMAMDVITEDGFVRGLFVGSIASCKGAVDDSGFRDKFPPKKAGKKVGGGC